jgi:hypothetical protein
MTHITVPDQTPSADFAVTSSQSDFAISFTVFDQTDLRVTVNGQELLQADFTFVGTPGYEGGYPGGTVTLDTPVTSSAVRIWSEIPPARVNDFLEGPGVPSRSINTEFDRITARMRDMRLRMERAPVIAHSSDHTLEETEAGQVFTNEGASATVTFTLPPCTSGLKYPFAVVVAHSLVISRDGSDTIGGSAASSLTGTGIGSMIVLRGTDSGIWLIESQTGTWG